MRCQEVLTTQAAELEKSIDSRRALRAYLSRSCEPRFSTSRGGLRLSPRSRWKSASRTKGEVRCIVARGEVPRGARDDALGDDCTTPGPTRGERRGDLDSACRLPAAAGELEGGAAGAAGAAVYCGGLPSPWLWKISIDGMRSRMPLPSLLPLLSFNPRCASAEAAAMRAPSAAPSCFHSLT